ncbi:hypothetical protein Aperf_G00000115181 [Anoplocephala perfoliata]
MFSPVQLYGKSPGGECGYCKGSGDKSTWYISTHKLLVSDYKILMDSGWRRSGTLIYKPNNRETCCPSYTIRCDAKNFRITKAQRKILRVVSNFLSTGEKPKVAAKSSDSTDCRGDHPVELINPPNQDIKLSASGDTEIPVESKKLGSKGRSGSARKRRWQALQDRMAKRAQILGVSFEDVYNEYLLRRKKRLDKNKPKEIEEYLDLGRPKDGAAHFIDSIEFERTFDREYETFKPYQAIIHNDPPSRWSRNSFSRFLVTSPLISEHDKKAEAAGAPQFGSYHQQYWLDGKRLIAVGVIDLVPGCLSSVYFFYDPEYSFLHLGTYSALREIAFVRSLHRTYGGTVPAYADFTQYYMGYYIQSCVKMRYKAAFKPSFLICPETYTWVPIERCQRLLADRKYTRFAEDDVAQPPSSDANSVVILLPNSPQLKSMLQPSKFTEEDDVIVTTLEAVGDRILTDNAIQWIKEWRSLIISVGSMRVDYAH